MSLIMIGLRSNTDILSLMMFIIKHSSTASDCEIKRDKFNVTVQEVMKAIVVRPFN